LAGDGVDDPKRKETLVKRTTPSGNRRAWTIAGLALALVAAVALTAAAQPAAQTPAPDMSSGMGHAGHMMRGMSPGQPAAAGKGTGCGMNCCGMGHSNDGPRMRRGGPGGMEPWQHLLMAADQIGLTDAQKTQLHDIRRRAPSVLMPKRQALMEARIDFQDVMVKKDAAAADIRKAHDKLLKAQTELRAATFDLHMQAREVLTPEQREKLQQHMKGAMLPGGGPGPMGMLDPGAADDEPLGSE
jgi:Spy/CpxP family protein refolding chaperone